MTGAITAVSSVKLTSMAISEAVDPEELGGWKMHTEITGMVEDVAYQIRTPEFWNACSAICDESDYRLGGSFFDGKGQPSQVSAVSHGSSTARFDGINVINTARSLG